LKKLGLSSEHIIQKGSLTELGKNVLNYFRFRAETLNGFVEPRLMDVQEAKIVFEDFTRNSNRNAPSP